MNFYLKKILISIIFCLLLLNNVGVMAEQYCAAQIATPDKQFIQNNDGTVTHLTTGLMWKVCFEGQQFTDGKCAGNANTFNWTTALQQAGMVNNSADSAYNFNYNDWRLPNIKELVSIINYGCVFPALNINVFKYGLGDTQQFLLSSTPSSTMFSNKYYLTPWAVEMRTGETKNKRFHYDSYKVRLVRSL